MKQASDLFQILLSLPGPFGYAAAVLLVVVLWQVGKASAEIIGGAVWALGWLRRRFVRLSGIRITAVCAVAVPVYFARFWVSDQVQIMEQYFNPAYITGDTSAHVMQVYEAELEKHCGEYEADVVKRRTREIAAKVGCSPLALFEVYYSECADPKRGGINPFIIRDDGVAAGIIQFTTAGAEGITTLPEVKAACKRRDIAQIMDWTEAYMVRAANGRRLGDATGVYTAVFAPGFIGANDGQVLYHIAQGDAYTLNRGFDGYYIGPGGRIIRTAAAMDGKITIGELRLHLEAKKARLLKKI